MLRFMRAALRSFRFSRLLTRSMVVMLTVLWPAAALAAAAPPSPTLQKAAPVWLGYLVMAGLLMVVLLISLMPSKRSHQD